MSPLENANHVEKLTRRLRLVVEDIGLLDSRLRRAGWQDFELEDLELARAQLRQAIELLARHARRWRRYPLGGER